MLDLLRDPIWQFVGAAVAVFGIGIPWAIYRLQRQTKELAFGVVSSRRLLSVADEVSSRVTVQIDGKTVRNLHLLVYGFKNSGYRAVVPTDFERPLSVSFSDAQIVSAEIASQTPSNLGATLIISESRVELRPLLLNAADQVLFQVLVSANEPAASVDARIVDVSALASIDVRPRLPPFFESGLGFAMHVYVVIAVGIYVLLPDRTPEALLFLGLAVFVAVFGIATRLFEKARRSSRRYIGEA